MAGLTVEQRAELTKSLDAWGGEYDASGEWPQRCVDLMVEMGAWRWNVPKQYGGEPFSHRELLEAYAAVAAGCVSSALISTQRDGAIELIASSPNEAFKQKLLPALARGDFYTTVGIAQLTTSKRGGGQLMQATPEDEGYRLTGMMPWATGAVKAKWIVTGAVLADGNQILACVPTDREGLRVDEPDALFTLNASRTSCVHCENFRVEPDELLRGPAERVLALRTPVKPLVTSACGIGVADALYGYIHNQRQGVQTHFRAVLEPLLAEYHAVRKQLFDAADRTDDPAYEAPSTDIRIAVNAVVMRLALTALTLSKGSGFLMERSIQRHVREALFFLVWSAPVGVQLETLVRLMEPLAPGAA
ncbi:MAG: acyl-CoA/acyl-ACP dehydrogenase [Phycisphaerales bacterium]|nr:acyl-CoA/acyl-ACP dehydrogenase [Phycisphaerales bacterium]